MQTRTAILSFVAICPVLWTMSAKLGSPAQIQTAVARVRAESNRSLYDRAKIGSGRVSRTLEASFKDWRLTVNRSRCANGWTYGS